ncbi:MAG: hypothetical protein ABI663_18355 [Chryseolinea sp.]
MKTKFILSFLIAVILFGCDKHSDDPNLLNEVDGLSLYWDHEVFGDEGRRLRFEFRGTKELENSYELIFDYSINQKDILIELIVMIDNGKCPSFPTGNGIQSLCAPRGGIFIPDSVLLEGTYTITLKTPKFQSVSELKISDEKYILNISPNDHFSSSISQVYPIPLNLLFGSVVYSGDENTQYANEFLNDLLTLGLTQTNVPYYPYRHLSVNEDGTAISSNWQPENHSLSFIYTMDNNFEAILNLAKEHFNKANINIYLYSSDGDEARLTKSN